MNERVQVPEAQVDFAFGDVRKMMAKRLVQHGRGGYIGPHETYGILAEELNKECLDAVHANDVQQVIKELIDVAVGAIFGIASLRENEIKKAEEYRRKADARFKPVTK